MNTFRQILFWTHLVAGLVAGLIIFVMSFTGTIIAFEDEIVAWAERDARRVEFPAGSEHLTLDQLSTAFTAAHPDKKPSAITVSADPAAAVTFAIGRGEAYYVNPYTGEVRQPASTGMHDFMHTMVAWHRWLGREGDSRAVGKAITGASNTAFVVLAVTGLYLWWPRKWRLKGLKRSLWFVRSSTGKARDWNWHNVFGFWLLIPITVMAVTGMVISYRWAGNLIYTAVGEEPPVRRGPPGPRSGDDGAPDRSARAVAPSLDSVYAAAATDQPDWTSISLRLPVSARASATVKVPGTWPRTASTSLTIVAGQVTERSEFGDLSTGRQLRTWSRFLHTGQALGWGGQLIAAIGCIGGCFLVYTGFALSWRRFFPGRKPTAV
ncbi:PepSY-associated TM helix domain-containing protein [Synoicihabitans lomoniglobus]|uniref:PepSY-associated TM helix domain-containing protein n=1 Tax=Synoicihabitans lomoniglobus TaxID=2909285 RepID=A0AAE9ZWF4_9BACT|nr:PepSY-associated TM helix domain-containing protein [Opitutaceae bacterium LMO-M01]